MLSRKYMRGYIGHIYRCNPRCTTRTLRACNIHLTMAPRTSNTLGLKGLTEAESMLILPAARLCAALNYQADNPGGDYRHYARKASSELVHFLHP